MELRIVVFLFFVSVSAIFNTVLILLAYKAFSGLTSKVTDAVSSFRKNSEAREWIDSLQVAAEHAAAATEFTKTKMAEFDPALVRAQENYRRTLAQVDLKLEKFAADVNTTAERVRDVVAKPAFSVASFAAGMSKSLESPEP